jgi:ABC-type uncharacterized transport system permease subunit
MTATIFGIIAIAFYLGGAILQYFSLKGRYKSNRNKVLLLGATALVCHIFSFNGTLYSSDAGLNLGFYGIASLIGWIMAVLVTLSGIRKPLQNLFIGVYPIAAMGLIATLLMAFNGETGKAFQQLSPHLTSHILLSIFAYSVLTIAAIQASLLALQDHHLRHHKTNGLIMRLPALQVMEQLLFELIWIGVVLLTIAILTGIFFIDDMFAQHLVHKTILSIIAWCLFSTLLVGRHVLGWRGTTAIRWTGGGYVLLMLAFFGSKLVLEVILG